MKVLIDKNIIYESLNYKYKNFVVLNKSEKKMVLDWRNNKSISKYMVSSSHIKFIDHFNFIASLESREDRYCWLVSKNDIHYGVVNIFDVDRKNRTTNIGAYRNPQEKDLGNGLNFFWCLIDFLFFKLNFEMVDSYISTNNKISCLINGYLGFENHGKCLINGKEFYHVVCKKKDVENYWSEKNIRSMIDYYTSDEFSFWLSV